MTPAVPGGPTLATVALAAAGVLPALVITLFAGLVGVVALFLGSSCRRYALDFIDGSAHLAAALVGRSVPRHQPRQNRERL